MKINVFSNNVNIGRTTLRIALLLGLMIEPLFVQSQDLDIKGRITKALLPYEKKEGPGYAVSVVYDGKSVYKGYSGYSNIENTIPISSDTVFDVASVSKVFTGYAVALLIEENKIDLGKSIRHYLPSLPSKYQSITVSNLLYHTSGLWDWTNFSVVGGFDLSRKNLTYKDVEKVLRNNNAINFKAGDEISYSNTGYVLLAEIISRVSGQSYQQYLSSRLFSPLGMKDTNFRMPDKLISHIASSYQRKGDFFVPAPAYFSSLGSSAMTMSIGDLEKWMLNYYDVKVGAKSTQELMLKTGELNSGQTTAYGFGLGVHEEDGKKYFGHDGGWSEFYSIMRYYPEDDLGIAILCNYGCNIRAMLKSIKMAVINGEINSTNAEYPKEAPEYSSEVLKGFVGLYRVLPGWFLWINQKDDHITARQWYYGEFDSTVSIINPDALKIGKATIVFNRNNSMVIWRDDNGSLEMERVPQEALDERELSRYEGTYFIKGLGAIYEVRKENNELIISNVRDGDDTLKPLNKNYFLGSGQFIAEIKFRFDDNGNVDGLISSSVGLRNIPAKKVNLD